MVTRRQFLKGAGISLGSAALLGVGALAFNEYRHKFKDDGTRLCGTNLVTWRREGFFGINSVLENLIGIANHISLVTSYSMKSIYSGRISEAANTPSMESLEYAIRQIKSIGGIEILLKPHINVEGGHRPLIWAQDEFYGSYFKRLIYPLSEFAEKCGVNHFCIGTELMVAAMLRSSAFEKGIKGIRKRFSGKLTFAAYNSVASMVDFWDQLDFIGYNHYQPISKKNPTINEIEIEFQNTVSMLGSLANKYNKKILFTEYGCTSLDGCSQMPSTSQRKRLRKKIIDYNEQENYIKAFYNSFWEKEWCLGGDLWCAYNPAEINRHSRELDYYWLDKPVQATIEQRYAALAGNSLRFE